MPFKVFPLGEHIILVMLKTTLEIRIAFRANYKDPEKTKLIFCHTSFLTQNTWPSSITSFIPFIWLLNDIWPIPDILSIPQWPRSIPTEYIWICATGYKCSYQVSLNNLTRILLQRLHTCLNFNIFVLKSILSLHISSV